MFKLKTKKLLFIITTSVLLATTIVSQAQQSDRVRLDQIEQSLKGDVSRILCLDKDFATGAQPTDQAYAKAAANGFHSVLSLRARHEGVDLFRERSLVEQRKMKCFNIPVVPSAPRPEQADEFLRLAQHPAHERMLTNF